MDEDQYILRLPQPLVERMRFSLSSNKRRDAAGEDKKTTFVVDFEDERNATFTMDGTKYPATLMDLPALVETHKTADKRTFYKSGDIHQALVVRMPGDPAPPHSTLPDGLSPGARDARRRLGEPPRTFSSDRVESIEKRVKCVIDHKIKFRPKKDDPDPPEEEVVIEEETVPAVGPPSAPQPNKPAASVTTTTAAPPASASVSADRPPAPNTPVAPSPGPAAPSPGPVAPSPGPVAPSPAPAAPSPAHVPSAAATPVPLGATPGPDTPGTDGPQASPTPGDTPMPDADDSDAGTRGAASGTEADKGKAAEAEEAEDEEEEDDDDDDDDDDLDDMAGELMEDQEEITRKRIERANLDNKIAEQRDKIAKMEAQANKMPNAVLKNRILAKTKPLVDELKALQASRAELGD